MRLWKLLLLALVSACGTEPAAEQVDAVGTEYVGTLESDLAPAHSGSLTGMSLFRSLEAVRPETRLPAALTEGDRAYEGELFRVPDSLTVKIVLWSGMSGQPRLTGPELLETLEQILP